MRDFFILWMERIINVVIVLGAIGVFAGGIAVMLSPTGGVLQGLLACQGDHPFRAAGRARIAAYPQR